MNCARPLLQLILILAISAVICPFVYGQGPAVQKIDGIRPLDKARSHPLTEKPLFISTRAEAEKWFGEADFKKLSGKVNFEKQVVLVFAWSGSGQDKLSFAVLESFPEQIKFKYSPGRTKDLRSHSAVFAVRSNVLFNGKPVKAYAERGSSEFVKVEVKGKLSAKVFAIGAETTGVQIAAKNIVWELDLGTDNKLKNRVNQLNGQQVIVTGELTLKKGVEIRQRWIVKVKTIKAAKPE